MGSWGCSRGELEISGSRRARQIKLLSEPLQATVDDGTQVRGVSLTKLQQPREPEARNPAPRDDEVRDESETLLAAPTQAYPDGHSAAELHFGAHEPAKIISLEDRTPRPLTERTGLSYLRKRVLHRAAMRGIFLVGVGSRKVLLNFRFLAYPKEDRFLMFRNSRIRDVWGCLSPPGC
jgi:hypothetical protein